MIPPPTLHRLLADNLSLRPDRTAIVDGDIAYDYRSIGVWSEALAARLVELGVEPGDRVVVHLRKSVAEVVAMFAIARIGAVIVNVNWQWTIDQLCHVVGDCTPRVLIVAGATARRLADAPMPAPVPTIVVGEPSQAAVPRRVAPVERDAGDLAMILYTSGSTGRPKGVMLSHRNILTGAVSVARYLRLDADDRLLGVLPYSFDYGLNQLTTMMLVGGAVVHQAVMMPAEIVRTMQAHGVTGVAAVPPLWSQIVRLLAQSPAAFPALRRITNSGGKIPRNILERMPACFPGVDIVLMYGLTEAFRSTYLAPERFADKMGAIGRAIPDAEVFVIRAGQGIAGPGEAGELVHRGPLVSMGYWNQPAATHAKIRACPELRHLIGDEPVVFSGDIVRVDADGDLWFVGRDDGMIKTSGFRVSPDEIEELVCRSDMVADAVAYGVDDDDLGQVVHVAVTPLGDLDPDALLATCRRTMPHYMVPRRIDVWEAAMPRTASGKLDRPDIVRASRARADPPAFATPPPIHRTIKETTTWR